MKLSSLYNQVVKYGIRRDPRKNKQGIKSYPDSAILYGNPDKEVRKVLVGIDIEIGEILLAESLRRQQGLDLVISHHPEGRALASLYEVMPIQIDMLVKMGVPRNVSSAMMEERMREVERKLLPGNLSRPVDAARLLDMPFMCIHTPADNHAYWFVNELLSKAKPKKVQDIIDALNNVPEYKEASQDNLGPRVMLGNPKRKVGKILIEMTGGTEGHRDIFDKLYKAGVRTLVSMHLSEEHLKKVNDANLNVVIAGHISSDTLGLNLLLDSLEKQEKLEVVGCSGFRRIRHN